MENKTDIALIKKDIKYIRDGMDDIKQQICAVSNENVKKVEFDLVNENQNKRIGQLEKLVYSAVGLALITLGKALLDLIVVAKANN